MFDAANAVKLIKAAKGDPVNFAFAAGAKKSQLAVDKLMAPQKLMAEAKSEAGGGKCCCGTVTFDGSAALFASDAPLSGLPKLIQEWLKKNGASLTCRLAKVDERGEEADEQEADGERPEEVDEDVPDNKMLAREAVIAGLKMARKQPMNFGYGDGAAPFLALHKSRDGEALARLVKSETGAKRIAFGTVNNLGRVVEFHCGKKPLSGMKRHLRDLFKEWGLSPQVRLFGPDGEDLEDDGGKEAGDDLALAISLANKVADPMKSDAATLGWSAEEFEKFLAAATAGRTLWGQRDQGKLEECIATLRRAVELHDQAQAQAPLRARGHAALEELQRNLVQMANHPSAADLQRQWLEARAALTSKADLGIAQNLVVALRSDIAAVARAPRFSLVNLGKSRLAWRSERLHAIAELGRLQSALGEVFADVKDQAQALSAALARLQNLIRAFGPELDDLLDDVLNADEAKRPQVIDQAKASMRHFQSLVDGDEVLDAIDGNEILPDMEVTAPLRQRLANIAQALG